MAESSGIGARLRAGVAHILAAFASLFHGAERWAQGGVRATLMLALALVIGLVVVIGVAREVRGPGGWASAHRIGHGAPGGAEVAKPAGKPDGKPEGWRGPKPAGKPEGGPVGKPERPGGGGEGTDAAPL